MLFFFISVDGPFNLGFRRPKKCATRRHIAGYTAKHITKEPILGLSKGVKIEKPVQILLRIQEKISRKAYFRFVEKFKTYKIKSSQTFKYR